MTAICKVEVVISAEPTTPRPGLEDGVRGTDSHSEGL